MFLPKNIIKLYINDYIMHKKNINKITIDKKHDEYQKKFTHNQKKVIPNLIKNRERLNIKLTNAKYKTIEEKLDIIDEIKHINHKIKTLRNKEKNYYLNNANYIFNYFENKKEICENNNDNKKILASFFNLNNKKENKKHVNFNNEKYLKNIESFNFNTDKYVVNTDICPKCKEGELIKVEHEGIVVCNNNKCGIHQLFFIDNDKVSYKDPPKEVCFYSYKRINHFREILAQFQAKESTDIPEEVTNNILLQLKKERLTLNELTNSKAKEILKKLGYNKYYEHIPFIKDKLGIKPPVMSPELEDTLCSLFLEIQLPYAKFCPDDRVNFLNYYYTVYKLCELLDQRSFLPYFPMLKDREKRIEQDFIWQKICKELNWDFIPTI